MEFHADDTHKEVHQKDTTYQYENQKEKEYQEVIVFLRTYIISVGIIVSKHNVRPSFLRAQNKQSDQGIIDIFKVWVINEPLIACS